MNTFTRNSVCSRNGSITKYGHSGTIHQNGEVQKYPAIHSSRYGNDFYSSSNLHMKNEVIARMIRSNTADLHPKLLDESVTSIDDLKFFKYHNDKRYAHLSMNGMNHLNHSILSLGQKSHITGDTLNKPLYRKDIFYSRSVMKLADSVDNVEYIGSYYHDLDETEEAPHNLHSEENQTNECKNNICKGLKLIAGLSILKKPVFLLAVAMSVLWTSKCFSYNTKKKILALSNISEVSN